MILQHHKGPECERCLRPTPKLERVREAVQGLRRYNRITCAGLAIADLQADQHGPSVLFDDVLAALDGA